MELDIIKLNTTWNDAAGSINNNFLKCQQAIDTFNIPQRMSYHHIQSIPSEEWIIQHNLGFFPNVKIVDSNREQVYGDIVFNDENTVTLKFGGSFSGDAYLD